MERASPFSGAPILHRTRYSLVGVVITPFPTTEGGPTGRRGGRRTDHWLTIATPIRNGTAGVQLVGVLAMRGVFFRGPRAKRTLSRPSRSGEAEETNCH